MTSNRYQIKEADFCVEILDDGIPMHYSTIVNRLNEQNETIQSITKEKQYFLKVIFAMGNYAEKGDYERIIDARDNVKQGVLE